MPAFGFATQVHTVGRTTTTHWWVPRKGQESAGLRKGQLQQHLGVLQSWCSPTLNTALAGARLSGYSMHGPSSVLMPFTSAARARPVCSSFWGRHYAVGCFLAATSKARDPVLSSSQPFFIPVLTSHSPRSPNASDASWSDCWSTSKTVDVIGPAPYRVTSCFVFEMGFHYVALTDLDLSAYHGLNSQRSAYSCFPSTQTQTLYHIKLYWDTTHPP